jgi:hypothetical protein
VRHHIVIINVTAAITDEELLVVSKNLHAGDVNGAVVTLDLQSQTTAGNMQDLSLGP